MGLTRVALVRNGRRLITARRFADALEIFGAIVRAAPSNASAHYYLARANFYLGRIDRATKHLRRALRVGPHRRALEFLAAIAPFDPAIHSQTVLKYRKALHAVLRANSDQPHSIRRPASRRLLRIGYVSSFFENDNWMKPVWGLIDHHDRSRVELHLFSDAPRSALTHRLADDRDRFHDISRLDNARAAGLIARQTIDVLVDLNGFSNRARLPLLVAKPAPILVAWFNIFATTGMSCFDAIIGDEWVVKSHEERWYVERVIRLPMSCLTFDVTYSVPAVRPPPCLRNGFITFGSLASMYKLNAGTIGAWARILNRSPRSRLVLGNRSLDHSRNREHLVGRFARLGIARARLTLLGAAEHREFLRHYDSIDIGLDPFPYSGGTTTMESIWQGVPVITAGGDRWIARTSASILHNAGLGHFVHADVAAYVDSAVRWGTSAVSPRRLGELRRTMRRRLRAAPVCDCSRFAVCMEDAYERLWQSAA